MIERQHPAQLLALERAGNGFAQDRLRCGQRTIVPARPVDRTSRYVPRCRSRATAVRWHYQSLLAADGYPEMLLTGAQFQRIHNALLDGYTPESLRQMVRIALEERMEVIAGGANFSDQVMNLIEWSAIHDRTPELIAAAHTHNPRNAALAELDRDAHGWFVAPAPVALAAQKPVATAQPPAAPSPSRETRTMTRNRTVPITVAVLSALLMLLLSLLGNLATTYVAEPLRSYATWVFLLLGLVFVASLAVLIWQMRAEPATLPADTTGARIEQSATDGSEIIRSPNRIAGVDSATISQSAAGKSRIEDSGNSIE